MGWVKIQRKSVVNPGERLEVSFGTKVKFCFDEKVLCYPHEYAEGLKNARNMWDYPYRHGWFVIMLQMMITMMTMMIMMIMVMILRMVFLGAKCAGTRAPTSAFHSHTRIGDGQ